MVNNQTPSGAGSRPSFSTPSISLPRGGGAIRGIGEKFSANAMTGAAAMAVPLPLSASRSQELGPKLSLHYDSGSGNGPFGIGWSLSLPSITRKTDNGLPVYGDAAESDVFLVSGAEDLVPVLKSDGDYFVDETTNPAFKIHRYRPRIEGLFARIERWTNRTSGDIHWRAISKENVTTLYGLDGNSRIADPADPLRIFNWLICRSFDDKGNAIVYQYAAEDDSGVDSTTPQERNRTRTANRYLKRIFYGNRKSRLIEPTLANADWMFEVVFDYDEAHCENLPLDASLPAEEQHRFVKAATSMGRSWSVRPDPFSSYRATFEVRTYRRCRRVLMFHHFPELGAEPCLIRSVDFDYADLDYTQPVSIDEELSSRGSTRFASFIRAVTQSGYTRDTTKPVDENGGPRYVTYLRKSTPPLDLDYSKATIQDEVLPLDSASLENLPRGLDGTKYQWVDLDGEGVSGILTEQAGAWSYKPNLGDGHFGPMQTLPTIPAVASVGAGKQLLDLDGDGLLDVVMFSGEARGFYERTFDADWEPFRAFGFLPDIAWRDPRLRFVDLDGDGHADVLITDDDAITWYRSLGEDGFSPARQLRQRPDEERAPRLVFADDTEAVHLADMSGDGLSDLLRIRNGEICYWPNLGYGRFGAKVTMDNAPRFDRADQFDQRRIRLADVDGSGVTDILYVSRTGVSVYFNQSGNRWSEPRALPQFPHVDDVSSIVAVDLFGNGTSCLVWSSPLAADARQPLRYIDLMGGTKPHLLISAINNFGAATTIHYASSTKFYLADKRRGSPWITRVPFPVQVVERVEIDDRISRNHFVTTYAYHHGYFDGEEREFRGFGMVEQRDSEELAALSAGGAPPLSTRTWYHTGAYLDRQHISDFFAGLRDASDTGEYYREPGLTDHEARALLLDDTVLPAGLTLEEEREACRALKGSMLRQETYALDGTAKEQRPYRVTEQNFSARLLQERGRNRHAVFLTHARESLRYEYERELVPIVGGNVVDDATAATDPNVRWVPDPRVVHTLTLAVDDLGNVVESASVGYGRRYEELRLPTQEDRDKQTLVLLTYTENRFTLSHDTGQPAIDDAVNYRTPLPAESKTYELTGLVLAAGANRFTPDQVHQAFTTAAALAYEAAPTAGLVQKRLIEHVRTYYRRDDLTGPLPLGRLQPLALPFDNYKLAFTASLVTGIYGARTTTTMFEDEGGFAHTESDAHWWIPSGRVFHSPDPTHAAAQELTYANEHFFLALRYRDPFHTSTVSTEMVVTFDSHDLLVRETRDAVGNRTTAGERQFVLPDGTTLPARNGLDYRVLQPSLIMDPNRNRSAAAFDALGLVAGTAVMGKPEETPTPGDRIDSSFHADLTVAEIDEFLANPRGTSGPTLLADATSRIVYDVTAHWRDPGPVKKPTVAATINRETHTSDATSPSRLQVAFSYSDGFGREIQGKVTAEPGPVPRRDANGAILIGADGRPEMTATDADPRWVGSGWKIFNNKANPVRQYEPFFTDTHRFEFDVRIGVSSITFYDGADRTLATLHADHTWEKIVRETWRQISWDVNDTVALADPTNDADVGAFFSRIPATEYLPTWHALRTDAAHAAVAALWWPDTKTRDAEKRAALKTAIHAASPTIDHYDTLGRAFLTIAHNKVKYSDTPAAAPPVEELLFTRTRFDIEGNPREIVDPAGRVVMRYDYDMLSTRIHQASMESGERWLLNDATAKQLYSWNSRNHRTRTRYDPLRRPADTLLEDGTGTEVLVGRVLYGEMRTDPEKHNLRGKMAEVRDQAGTAVTDEYDFKGNALRTSRRLAKVYDATIDWSGTPVLETETYSAGTRFDALNRAIQRVAPHSDAAGSIVNVVQSTYNEAGLLESIDAWLDETAEPGGLLDPATATLHVVTDIDYDARGRRERIEHGNGAKTVCKYDPRSLRLIELFTTRGAAFTGDCPQPQDPDWPGCGLQNLHYTYDPTGNVSAVRDDAQQTIYTRNKRVDPSCDYVYDARYRLVEATGREYLVSEGGPALLHSYNDAQRIRIALRGDGKAMGTYLERYRYDAADNITKMEHRGSDPSSPGWTRHYTYDEASLLEPAKKSNRLTSTTIGATTEIYSTTGNGYDAAGNMLRMPQLQVMRWDYKDQLQMTRRQAVDPADADGIEHSGERTWYVYDSAGTRVRKVTEFAAGTVQAQRISISELEIHRKQGASPLTRETLHIMDGEKRMTIVETRTAGTETGVPARMIRYQFANHMASSVLELDDQAQVVSYEEYAPYGSTTYQAVRSQTETPRRHRHNARERDEESGLQHHGARYYAPWLARWTSPDPAGLADGENLYQYAKSNPVGRVDPQGRQSEWFHNTGVEAAAKILDEGFKAGKSGWNYFMSDPTGAKAGAEVAASPVQMQVKLDVSGAKEITYQQWHQFFDEAKAELGVKDVPNNKLTEAMRKQVDFVRNQKAAQYMEAVGGEKFIINAEKGAKGQKFFAARNAAVKGAKVTGLTRGGEEVAKATARIAEAGEQAVASARFAKGVKFVKVGAKALVFVAAAADAYEIYTSENKTKTTFAKVAGWGTAWAGAKAGAWVAGGGALVAGQAGPQVAVPEEIVTVPVAGIIGGIIGGVAGYFSGEWVAKKAYDFAFQEGVSVGK
jgi:RHS repeat-associated protein